MKIVRETFSRNLKKLREAKGLTQKQLAKMAGIGNQVVVRGETKTTIPHLAAREAIAKVLGVSTEQLFEDPDKVPIPPPQPNKLFDEMREITGVLATANEKEVGLILQFVRRIRGQESKHLQSESRRKLP